MLGKGGPPRAILSLLEHEELDVALSSAEHRNGEADARCGGPRSPGSRRPDAPEASTKRPGQPSRRTCTLLPQGCRGVVHDAGVQAPGVRMTCCFQRELTLQPVRTWSFFGFESEC